MSHRWVLTLFLDSSVDPTFIDTKNRPAQAQTFIENEIGETFTLVVNHLQSKGTPCDDVGDPDLGDRRGNCNQIRTNAAIAEVNWLATNPTGHGGQGDYLIIGDLNTYVLEDPIRALKDRRYDNLMDDYIGSATAYSYIFDGPAGMLDHASGTFTMAKQVRDIWL